MKGNNNQPAAHLDTAFDVPEFEVPFSDLHTVFWLVCDEI